MDATNAIGPHRDSGKRQLLALGLTEYRRDLLGSAMVHDERIGNGPDGLVPIRAPGIDLAHSSDGQRCQRENIPFRETDRLEHSSLLDVLNDRISVSLLSVERRRSCAPGQWGYRLDSSREHASARQ